jgi:hypothetical protein
MVTQSAENLILIDAILVLYFLAFYTILFFEVYVIIIIGLLPRFWFFFMLLP